MSRHDYEVWDGLTKESEEFLFPDDSTFCRWNEAGDNGQVVLQSPISNSFTHGVPPVTPNVPDDYLVTLTPYSPKQTPPSSEGKEMAAQEIPTSGLSQENPTFKVGASVTTAQQPLLSSEFHCEESQPTEYPASGVETALPSTSQAMVVTSLPVPMVSFQNTSTLAENVICPLPQQQTQYLLVSQQAQMQSSSHAAVVGMVDIPALNDSEGEYGFTVTVEEKERTTKSPMWLMSRITNKLYTNLNKAVPFEIHLKKPIDSDQFFIRAVPVFSSPQFLRTNVTRCPNHAAPADSTNHDFPYPEHVVRADHPGAQYVKNASGRLSVVVPLDTLQDGSDYTPVLLRFMCLGSCVGGINRRPIAVVITLENSLGHVHGRKVIDVRVCACPTRDIRTDEHAVLNKGTKRKGPVIQEKTPSVSWKKPRPIEPKAELQDEDDKQFYIPVRGRQLYNFMMDMKAAYYRNHPDYATRYPEDNIVISNRLMED